MPFPPLGNSDHVVVAVLLTLHQTQKGMFRFITQLMTIFVLRGMVFVIIWEILRLGDVPSLKTGASPASEFCEWVKVGIDVHIPHHNYQVKPHSSPWFSAACAAAVSHRNHFFRLYQQNKPPESKAHIV